MRRLDYLFLLVVLIVGCNSAEIHPTPIAVHIDPTPLSATAEPTPTNTPQVATPTLVVTEAGEVVISAEATPTNDPLPTPTAHVVESEPTPISISPTAVSATTIPVQPTAVPATSLPVQPTATSLPTWTPQPATPTAPPVSATQPPSPQPTQAPATATPLPPTATSLPTATNTPSPPTNTPPPPQPLTTNIGDVAALPADTEVTISGNIVATSSFARGFKFTVQDGTGRVTLLMWDNVYDECWDKNVLNVGATIVATGNTGNFDGEIQIAPWWGGGVDVTTPGYPWAPPHTINELGGFMNQRAMIEGDVISVDVTETFTKMKVNDGTGEVEVFMWPNIWVRVPGKDALNGSRVKVVGVVGEFRGTLQLVPPLPVDVVKQ